ncbi:DUF1579 domain-containing protein [Terricaulis sp.]|uniref:DUF1579 domain-containing protein n=1 Tax=Terricaulis sp. TaxID=2768686 RepID=UPI003784F6B7
MNQDRREVLNAGAGALLAAAAGSEASAGPCTPRGAPGDFDFLTGEWRIRHRRLPPGATAWDVFEGEATCWSILGGVGHVEELRIPARNFAGMGLRLLDVNAAVWTDFWVNARSGVLTPPGQTGTFANNVGTFEADDVDGDQPIKVRGIWDEITGRSHRWRQLVSRDGGASWEENWVMQWEKV